jgi:hypothetical protein
MYSNGRLKCKNIVSRNAALHYNKLACDLPGWGRNPIWFQFMSPSFVTSLLFVPQLLTGQTVITETNDTQRSNDVIGVVCQTLPRRAVCRKRLNCLPHDVKRLKQSFPLNPKGTFLLMGQ